MAMIAQGDQQDNDFISAFYKGKRVGIREVVEWIEKNGIVPNHIPFANIEIQHHPWQAQKKVWGIEDVT